MWQEVIHNSYLSGSTLPTISHLTQQSDTAILTSIAHVNSQKPRSDGQKYRWTESLWCLSELWCCWLGNNNGIWPVKVPFHQDPL